MINYFKGYSTSRAIAIASLTSCFTMLFYFTSGIYYDIDSEQYPFANNWYAMPVCLILSFIIVVLIDLTAGVGRTSPLFKDEEFI